MEKEGDQKNSGLRNERKKRKEEGERKKKNDFDPAPFILLQVKGTTRPLLIAQRFNPAVNRANIITHSAFTSFEAHNGKVAEVTEDING